MKTKNLIYTLLLCLLVGFNTSCETTELDGTIDPDAVSVDQNDPEFLFNNIQLTFNGFVQNVSGFASFSAQVTRMFAMTGSSVYQAAFSPNTFNGTWSTAYAGLLQDIEALEPIAIEDGLTYHLGASKVMKAYAMFTLVDMFGNVPYTQALLGNENLNPEADLETDVYIAAFAELDEAISLLGTDTTILPGNDFYFQKNGSVSTDLQANWITAAKSLKLRALNNIRLNGTAVNINVANEITALINQNDLIDTPEEDWEFQYGSSRLNPNTRHPGYNNYYEVTAGGYMSNYFMWTMLSEGEKGIDDPRLPFYFYRQDGNANGENIFTLGCAVQSAPGHYGGVTSIYNSNTVPFCVASFGRGYWGRDHGDNNGIPPDDEKRTVLGVYPSGGALDIDDPGSVQNEGEDGYLGAGITPIILSSDVASIKAEAALTLGTPGSPVMLLEEAIRASMSKVTGMFMISSDNDLLESLGYEQEYEDTNMNGVVDPENGDLPIGPSPLEQLNAAIDGYVTFVTDAFNLQDANGQLDILIKEFYIASFGNSLGVYNAYRRTGLPSNLQPTLEPNPGAYYRSALYPANYVNNNVNASQKEITQQIFWDTNSAGFIN